jgi:hypothetical protein
VPNYDWPQITLVVLRYSDAATVDEEMLNGNWDLATTIRLVTAVKFSELSSFAVNHALKIL